ncbi:hypothetical protein [Burkholderia vietnamiensis]|uniref:hypothetical protein n=1 Tax=Burkholderia vietnamiensis TaxID=60552 RepID=UPI001CF1458F|nr:hypothetical protein [Burkholderia vietnamiensis]MCA8287585.1 hypothetical protein [Burkholderia vietnamiensis]
MPTHAQRDAFDREVRYAIRHDLRSARALLTHGPQPFAAPERFLTYAIRRDDVEAVAMLTDLGAPVARALRKVSGIHVQCVAVLLKHATPAMLNATDGYFDPLWLAVYRSTRGQNFDPMLDPLEAAGADITWAGLERAFDSEEDLASFKADLNRTWKDSNTGYLMLTLRERLDRNAARAHYVRTCAAKLGDRLAQVTPEQHAASLKDMEARGLMW